MGADISEPSVESVTDGVRWRRRYASVSIFAAVRRMMSCVRRLLASEDTAVECGV